MKKNKKKIKNKAKMRGKKGKRRKTAKKNRRNGTMLSSVCRKTFYPDP